VGLKTILRSYALSSFNQLIHCFNHCLKRSRTFSLSKDMYSYYLFAKIIRYLRLSCGVVVQPPKIGSCLGPTCGTFYI